MTEQRAIEILKGLNAKLDRRIIKEVLQEEALVLAISALKKRIPQKVTPIDMQLAFCKTCKSLITKQRYCHSCGQKIDWKEDKNK